MGRKEAIRSAYRTVGMAVIAAVLAAIIHYPPQTLHHQTSLILPQF